MGILPFIFVLPVIGVVLAIGSPSDHVAHARRIARLPRNAVLDVALPAALAVVVGQPQLALPLVTPFGLDGSGVTGRLPWRSLRWLCPWRWRMQKPIHRRPAGSC